MQVYVYQASLFCQDCALIVERDIGNPNAASDGKFYNRLQGPYDNGGGEADIPQYCDRCFKFLENPLTREGENYVIDAAKAGDGGCPKEWYECYAYLFD